ncbi:MAG: 2-oxoacid:acceptor oxidoreductase family protein [Planctomycetota bacterium]
MNKDRIEILIGGIGGQGVVYSANLIARAGLIRHKFASSMAHYGPESRGSVTTSEVVISNLDSANQIDYPVVEAPDVFIAMHQKAYEGYIAKHKSAPRCESGRSVSKGIGAPEYVIYDSTLVTINSALRTEFIPAGKRGHSALVAVPASQLAKDKLGNIMMANIILTAAFAKITGVITKDDLERGLKEMVSADDFVLNQSAIEIGFAIT